MDTFKLVATTTEGIVVRTLPADSDWFAVADQASNWSANESVHSVYVIDPEGYAQILFADGAQITTEGV